MRKQEAKYYYYKKTSTGIFYCSPISKTTGKKLYTISTGTKDYQEAKKIMDSWAINDAFPLPYKREETKSRIQLDIMSTLSTMATKKEFNVTDVITMINTLANTYRYEIANNVESFLTSFFSMLNIQVDLKKIIKKKVNKESNIKFIDFILNYWDYKNSLYIKDLVSMGTPISELPKESSFTKRGQIIKKYLDWFDPDILLKDVSAELINQFFSHLMLERGICEGYMASLANGITQPLRFAEKKKLITTITQNIKRYKIKATNKEILTIEECHEIFSSIDNFKNLNHYCVNRIAVETASRIGEILALRIKDLKISNSAVTGKEECWIEINKSYDTRTHKLGSTKTKERKNITISYELLQLLKELIEENPYKDVEDNPFLFFHSTFKDRPLSYNEITKEFKKLLENKGFKRPHLTFHSYRHLAVVMLSDSKASVREIMQITGHKTEKMVCRYANHETEAQKDNKRKLVEKITKNCRLNT